MIFIFFKEAWGTPWLPTECQVPLSVHWSNTRPMLDLLPYWCMSWELGFVSFSDAEFQWYEVSTVACSQLQPPQEAAVLGSLLFLFFGLPLVKESSCYHTFVDVPYATVFYVKSAASFKFLKSPIVFCSLSRSRWSVADAHPNCSAANGAVLKIWAIFNTHRHTHAHTRICLCVYIAWTGSGVMHCW